MRSKLLQLHARLAACAAETRADDRGSVLSEYGILLGVMALAALAGATYVATTVEGWFDRLPLPGG